MKKLKIFSSIKNIHIFYTIKKYLCPCIKKLSVLCQYVVLILYSKLAKRYIYLRGNTNLQKISGGVSVCGVGALPNMLEETG